MNPNHQKCPECGRQNTYSTITNSGGGAGQICLPGLGSFFRMAKFEIVVCADCGLTRFYTDAKARAKLASAKAWRRL
jgi:predicted nucleic-acid-binding Zn-ribbon protein